MTVKTKAAPTTKRPLIKPSGTKDGARRYTEAELVALFNEWAEWYDADPHAFQADVDMIRKRLSERLLGMEPSYGLSCVATLELCAKRLEAGAAGTSRTASGA